MMTRLSCLFAVVILVSASRSLALDVPAPPHTFVTKANANVRAKPSVSSEILLSLKKGQPVTVSGEIEDTMAAGDEPKRWAEVVLPAGTHVWIYGALVNPADKSIRPISVNLRAGPGRNYSEVGTLPHGTIIRELRDSDGWLEIEAPTGAAKGFIATTLLGDEIPSPPPGTVSRTPPPVRALPPADPRLANRVVPLPSDHSRPNPTVGRLLPSEERVTGQPLHPATPPARPPTVTIEPVPSSENPHLTAPPVAPVQTPVATVVSEPAPVVPAPPQPVADIAIPVISQPDAAPTDKVHEVMREGVVVFARSPQAPSDYQLNNFRRGEAMIGFLYSEDPNLQLSDWRGKRVLVTAEEYLDPRWPRRPLLKVSAIREAY